MYGLNGENINLLINYVVYSNCSALLFLNIPKGMPICVL